MVFSDVLLSKDVLVAAGAIGFNYATTMGIIFVNKVLFLHTAFPVLSLTAAHLGVSALFTRLALVLGIFKAREAKMDWIIFTVAALQGLAISLGQASLKMNSMSFFQLTKQMQVPLVATIEYFWLGRGLSSQKIWLLLAMTFGVCMSNVSDVQFTYLGAVMALAGTMCTSAEVVLYSWLQQSKGWETLQLLYNTMPYCTAFMTLVAVFNDVLPQGFFVNLLSGGGGGKEGAGAIPPIELELFHINAMGIILFLSSCALGRDRDGTFFFLFLFFFPGRPRTPPSPPPQPPPHFIVISRHHSSVSKPPTTSVYKTSGLI